MEQLGFLQITEEASSEYKQTNTEISVAPIPAAVATSKNVQAGMPKSIVPDLGWFDSDQTKFEDWWREIRLFLKSNRVIETGNRIMAILACLKGGVAGIYTQRKLDELDEETRTQNWEEFVQEIKTMFSDKMKTANTE